MTFVDTSFFVALLDPRDKNHVRAVEAFEGFQNLRLKDQLLTTNNVDCLSFVVMEKLGIHEALAFDADFGHRFVMRPGPAR